MILGDPSTSPSGVLPHFCLSVLSVLSVHTYPSFPCYVKNSETGSVKRFNHSIAPFLFYDELISKLATHRTARCPIMASTLAAQWFVQGNIGWVPDILSIFLDKIALPFSAAMLDLCI